ncbi:hypothetical protein GH714_043911 [Hevea brasiliensis]|uniref:RNase H type-1 domain-containing protein n=1 Tax=Hevea brasiliensis TaxID=3981 RepID=A0A6A6K0K7_HEVBR|nr:hypothetical protein GH714_043911 [Hevea brasiliensis]
MSTDTSVPGTGKVELGMVIRDHHGHVMMAASRVVSINMNPAIAEIRAIDYGWQIALDAESCSKCNGSEVPHSYSWQLARPSQAVSCSMELTSVNLYRGPRCRTRLELPSHDNVVSEQGSRRSESGQAPQRDRGRQGADGDKGVARIGWRRMSGLNGTEVDKGFSIPRRTRKGSIRGISAAYHAACMCLASNMMNLGKAFLKTSACRRGECTGKLVANMLLKCLRWASTTNGVWTPKCEGV